MSVLAPQRWTRRLGEAVFLAFCWIATAVALMALAAIMWSLLSQGLGGLDLNIFTKSTPAPGSEGGLLNAIMGSLMMTTLPSISVGLLAGGTPIRIGAASSVVEGPERKPISEVDSEDAGSLPPERRPAATSPPCTLATAG